MLPPADLFHLEVSLRVVVCRTVGFLDATLDGPGGHCKCARYQLESPALVRISPPAPVSKLKRDRFIPCCRWALSDPPLPVSRLLTSNSVRKAYHYTPAHVVTLNGSRHNHTTLNLSSVIDFSTPPRHVRMGCKEVRYTKSIIFENRAGWMRRSKPDCSNVI